MRTSPVRVAETPRNNAGFSLVELMVVLLLIGLAATAVVLTLPAGAGDARAQATRFAARVAALRDRAVIESRPMGLWATASGYGFEGRAGDGWVPLTDRTLTPADWQAGTAVAVDGAAQGRLTFDRLGLPDAPLRLDLTQGGGSATVLVTAAGEVELR